MATLPKEVRDAVLTELGKQFDAVRWEEASSSKTSEMYDRFVKDPAIGGRLKPFLAPEKIRVWIKDGPAKEYRRALEGQGYMEHFTARAYPGPEAVVRSALGPDWSARVETVEEKPMRCFAVDENEQSMFVIWAPFSGLQGLIWNSCLLRAEDPYEPITIVVTKPNSAPINPDEWGLVERLAEIVDAECKQVTYAVTRKKPRVDFAYSPAG